MRRTARLLAGIALLGCADQPTALRTDDAGLAFVNASAEHQDVAALRAATARFHRFDVANAAGEYDRQFPPGCFEDAAGAMGFHYIRDENVGTLDPTRPQLLMFEPQKDGQLRLVGVEFIHPGADTDPPPVLFDQEFRYNSTFGVWVLHVWAWRNNPDGLYSDWNPAVSCAHAGAVAAGSHH